MKICIFCMAAAAGCVAAAPDQPKAKPCSTPEYHQFDFWIGDWDAVDVDNPATVVARTWVDLILEGCVLREDCQGTGGYKGQSFTIYDNRRATLKHLIGNRPMEIETLFAVSIDIADALDAAHAQGIVRFQFGIRLHPPS